MYKKQRLFLDRKLLQESMPNVSKKKKKLFPDPNNFKKRLPISLTCSHRAQISHFDIRQFQHKCTECSNPIVKFSLPQWCCLAIHIYLIGDSCTAT